MLNLLQTRQVAEETNRPQIYTTLDNGVVVIVMPEGTVRNVVGEENAKRVVDGYKKD